MENLIPYRRHASQVCGKAKNVRILIKKDITKGLFIFVAISFPGLHIQVPIKSLQMEAGTPKVFFTLVR